VTEIQKKKQTESQKRQKKTIFYTLTTPTQIKQSKSSTTTYKVQ